MRDIIDSLEVEAYFDVNHLKYRLRLYDNHTGDDYYFDYEARFVRSFEEAIDKALNELYSQWKPIL